MENAGSAPQGRQQPTLVLLHGSGDDAHIWDAVCARLTDFQTVALDLPGHGALLDRPGPQELSVRDYADDVRAALTRCGLEHVCLIGHSLGSAIALRTAVDHPALASRVALVGAGARLRVLPALLDQARSDPRAAKWELARHGFAAGHEDDARRLFEALSPVAPGVLYRDLAACDRFDMMDELGHVAQPVLLITGEEDQLTPPKYARYLKDNLAQAELVLVPGAGHYVQIEAPAAVADAIRVWVGAPARV